MVDEIRDEAQCSGGTSCLLPLTWMFAGNAVLAVLAVVIVTGDRALLSLESVGFWLVVGLVALARYVDVTRCEGTTTDGGTPATVNDVKRFSVRLAAIATGTWVLAHAL